MAEETNHLDSSGEIPLWEVFIRPRNGLAHRHCGSLHAADAEMAIQAARDVYTRRGEGTSVWVIPSSEIVASDPQDSAELFDPSDDKIYRHPTFYDIPDEIGHM
ncbi:MAG: 1,2-phenylacetyl-CoA epoxidase subunit PaaB [Hyphomicrobiales bacterium]